MAARRALAAQDLDCLADAALVEQLWALGRELDGLEGQWLRRLAAGADPDRPAPSTASWLRRRLRMSVGPPTGVSAPPGPCSVVFVP